MDTFTFETNETKEIYETYEWDNIWIEHANDRGADRVFYIGDSISCGIRHEATASANNELLFDGFGSSKAVDNPFFQETVSLVSKQEPSRKAVLFNNGLHGWHLDDETEYRFYFEKTIRFLMKQFSEVPIAVVLTTTLKDIAKNERVLVRNQVASEIAKQYELPIIDLYAVSKKHTDLLKGDGVHFTEEGYQFLAKTLVSDVKKIIEQ